MFTAVSPVLPVFRIVDILIFLWEKEGKNLFGWNAIKYILHTITSYNWIKHQLSLSPILAKHHLYSEHHLAKFSLLTGPIMCQARCWLSEQSSVSTDILERFWLTHLTLCQLVSPSQKSKKKQVLIQELVNVIKLNISFNLGATVVFFSLLSIFILRSVILQGTKHLYVSQVEKVFKSQ